MTGPRRILLFDLDGVLVAPFGYRRAIHATLEHFSRRMGLGDCYPGEEVIALFESISMTSEWDIVPTCLAALLEALLGAHPGLHLPVSLEETCAYLTVRQFNAPRQVDYHSLVQRLGASYSGGAYSDHILDLCQPVIRNGYAKDADQPPIFPLLSASSLLVGLFTRTRQVTLCPTTRLFQTFALGSAVFSHIYDQPAALDTPSYLRSYDQPLIQAEARCALLTSWRAGQFDLAVCTARPSLPGAALPGLQLSYSPEAELALEVTGLQDLPLVGYGQVCCLAELTGHPPDEMVKPSPVQALAAVGVAFRRELIPALLGAERLAYAGDPAYFHGFPPLQVHIFEDSVGGVRAVRQAADLLSNAGIPVAVRAWGISANPDKATALRHAGAQIFSEVNQALTTLLL